MIEDLHPSTFDWVRNQALRFGLSEDGADTIVGVVQDRVIKYWHREEPDDGLAEILGKDSEVAERYVRRMTTNAILSMRKREERRSRREQLAATGYLGDPLPIRPGTHRQAVHLTAPDTADEAERSLIYDMLLDAAAALPQGQQADFKLFASGLRPSEIAELRGVSRQAVTKSLRSAFEKLRAMLGDQL